MRKTKNFMYSYIVKYNNFVVRVSVKEKQLILDDAVKELKLLTAVCANPLIWVHDKKFDEFVLTNFQDAPDEAILKLKDPPTPSVTNEERFVKCLVDI